MTKDELREYIIRKLGGGFINVELSDEQLNDIIQDALDRFNERHYEATINNLYKLTLVDGQNEYDLPTNIKSIVDIYPASGIFSQLDMTEKILIPMTLNPYNSYLQQGSASVADITTWRMSVQDMQNAYSLQDLRFDFNLTMNRIYIPGDTQTLILNYGTNALYLFVNELPADKLESVYNQRWFKAYAVALAMVQWGLNLIKFRSAPLPGGAELNGDGILSEGKEMVASLEEQLEDEFTEPADMVIG